MSIRELRQKVRRLIRKPGGVFGLAVRDLLGGDELLINENEVFPAASVIKVGILAELMRQTSAGKLSLSDVVHLKDEDKVGGSGILFELHAGLELTVNDLAVLMMVQSDNTAGNLLIDMVSMASVNEYLGQLGLSATRLERKFMDYEARDRGRENVTTPWDMMRLLELIYRERLPHSRLMLDILCRQQDTHKMRLLLPDGVRVGNKGGELDGVRHDVGIVLTSHPYVFCALTRDQQDVVAAELAIARLSRLFYDYFASTPSSSANQLELAR
jgi:beta-lactamase class A